MKKIVFVLLLIVNIVMMTSCFPRYSNPFTEDEYNANNTTSHLTINNKNYVIEDSFLKIKAINKETYLSKNSENVVKSFVKDNNGNLYYSFELGVKIQDYKDMCFVLKETGEKMGIPDTYRFNMYFQNDEISLNLYVLLYVQYYDIVIKNMYSKCNINNKIIDNCDFFLVFRRGN